jgi:hypothetical protein
VSEKGQAPFWGKKGDRRTGTFWGGIGQAGGRKGEEKDRHHFHHFEQKQLGRGKRTGTILGGNREIGTGGQASFWESKQKEGAASP